MPDHACTCHDHDSSVDPPKKISKLEYARLIGIWGAIFVLVIFTYQLGQWNAHHVQEAVRAYCPTDVIASVSTFGDLALWHNVSVTVPLTVP